MQEEALMEVIREHNELVSMFSRLLYDLDQLSRIDDDGKITFSSDLIDQINDIRNELSLIGNIKP